MKSRVQVAIERLLEQGYKLTKYEASADAHCDQRTAQRVLRKIHASGATHITKWVPVYRQKIPEYAGGAGVDAKKPKPVSAKKRARLRRSDPSYAMRELMQKRAKRSVASKTHVPDKNLTSRIAL